MLQILVYGKNYLNNINEEKKLQKKILLPFTIYIYIYRCVYICICVQIFSTQKISIIGFGLHSP